MRVSCFTLYQNKLTDPRVSKIEIKPIVSLYSYHIRTIYNKVYWL